MEGGLFSIKRGRIVIVRVGQGVAISTRCPRGVGMIKFETQGMIADVKRGMRELMLFIALTDTFCGCRVRTNN